MNIDKAGIVVGALLFLCLIVPIATMLISDLRNRRESVADRIVAISLLFGLMILSGVSTSILIYLWRTMARHA